MPFKRPLHRYVFDLSRRSEGLVVGCQSERFDAFPKGVPTWQCVAADDADALRQVQAAAFAEWPALADRKPNDFIVRFVSPERRGAEPDEAPPSSSRG